jgi:hypothetical protein
LTEWHHLASVIEATAGGLDVADHPFE